MSLENSIRARARILEEFDRLDLAKQREFARGLLEVQVYPGRSEDRIKIHHKVVGSLNEDTDVAYLPGYYERLDLLIGEAIEGNPERSPEPSLLDIINAPESQTAPYMLRFIELTRDLRTPSSPANILAGVEL